MASNYKTSKDFIAYFLQSQITKEPEFEIRITAKPEAIQEFQRSLKDKGIPFRKIGLDIFPPPSMLLLEYGSIKDALRILHSWYINNKAKKGLSITLVRPDATLEEIKDENQILEIIESI